MASKGQKFNKYTEEYIQLVEEWILFYNTKRLKSKVKQKRKTYTKREK